MSGMKQLLAQIPNTVESRVRTSYIICDAQRQQEIAGPFVQKSLWISRWQQEILKPSAEPSLLVQQEKNLPAMQETPGCMFYRWVGKIPWSRKWQPTQVPLPGKFHEQRSLVGYSPWGCEDLNTTEKAHQEPSEGWIPITPKFSRSVVCCGGEPFKVAVMATAFCL